MIAVNLLTKQIIMLLYLLSFSLIAIAFLIVVSVYFYLIKYQAKTKTFTNLLLHYYQIKRNWVLKICYKMESNDKLKETNTENCT